MNTEALDRLKLIVESVLFVADEPVDIGALARIAEAPLEDVRAAIDALAADCHSRGVRLQRTESAVQMVSAPEATQYVERYLGVEEDHRLSHASLETLAIIAYKQPITRQAIEAIRGVNCDRALASLRARGLITEVGRAGSAGRPYLFGTTFRFLEYFGLEKPEDLPPLEGPGAPAGSEEGEPLAMTVGLCRVWLRLPQNHSLKDKRQVVKSLIARLHNKFNVAVAEVDDHDRWQMVSLGISCVTTSEGHAHQVMSSVIAFIRHERPDAEMVDYRTEIVHALSEGLLEG